ncbi:MAG: hypothetical protein AAGF72_02475 [Pseudomonadota bacterium]
MNRFQVNIDAPKAGWLRIRIAGRGGEICITASDVPADGFYDLVSSMRALYEFGGSKVVRLHEEPDWIEISFSKVDNKLVVEAANSDGAPVRLEAGFDTGCREFARRFKFLLEEVGYAVFAKEWQHRLPRDEIRKFWAYFE